MKSTDQWLPDEGSDGVIWSGRRGRIKGNQHPARYILDTDGAILRPPLPGGEDPSVLAGPSRRMAGRRAQRLPQRQAQLIACAQAVAELAEHRELQPLRVHDVEHDVEIIAQITPAEHRKLGGMFKVPGLYGRMYEASVSELPDLGWERYRAEGIAVQPAS